MSNHIVLFQGDSITDVGRSRDVEAESQANIGLGGGYPALAAARLCRDYPGGQVQVHNRGISGNRVVDLYARWKRDALNLRPTLLSILIGVNDTWHERIPNHPNGVEVPRYEQIYRELLQWTRTALPDCRLLLMQPFVLPVGAVQPDWLDEMAQRGEVTARLAAEAGALYLPCQQLFDAACHQAPAEYWLRDGVHPTLAGHQLLADAWLAMAKPFI